MYAYQQQQKPERRLHVVPDKKRRAKVLPKPAKHKRINPVLVFIRLVVSLAFLSVFMYFVFPTSFNNLIRQVFFPQKLPATTAPTAGMAYKNWTKPVAADIYSIANPITNYLSNDLFNNRLAHLLKFNFVYFC